MMPTIVFIMAIVLSLLSQTPAPGGEYHFLALKYFWAVTAVCLLATRPRDFFTRNTSWMIWLAGGFVFYLFVLQTFRDITYIGDDAVNMLVSTAVAIVSFAFWRNYGSERSMRYVVLATLAGGLIVAAAGWINVLRFVSVAQYKYATIGKNSLGPILLSVCVITLANFKILRKRERPVAIAAMLFMLVVIFTLKSRATLLALAFVILFYIFRHVKQSTRLILVCVLTGAVIAVLAVPDLYQLVVKNVIFANRSFHHLDARNLDSVASGRLTLMMHNVVRMPSNLIWGIGVEYMDCFPLMQVVQFGVFGAALVFWYLIRVGILVCRRFNRHTPIGLCAFLLFWVFILNSLFEAQAPFGPGVKCFMLWMMFGFALADYSKSIKKC